MLTINPIAALQRAIALIQHGWVAGQEAIDIDGHNVEPHSEKAHKWCVLGSVKAATYLLDEDNYLENTKYIMSVITTASPDIYVNKSPQYGNGTYVETTNDHTNQERAIQMMQKGLAFMIKHPPKAVVSEHLAYTGNPKYERN